MPRCVRILSDVLMKHRRLCTVCSAWIDECQWVVEAGVRSLQVITRSSHHWQQTGSSPYLLLLNYVVYMAISSLAGDVEAVRVVSICER